MSVETKNNEPKQGVINSVPFAITKFFINATWYLCWFGVVVILFVITSLILGIEPPSEPMPKVPIEIEFNRVYDDNYQTLIPIDQRPIVTKVKGFASVLVAPGTKWDNIFDMLKFSVLLAMFMWGVHQLRLIIKSIKAGEQFSPLNPKRIRWIAWMIVIISQYKGTGAYLRGKVFIDLIDIPGATLSLEHNFNLDVLFVGLLIFVLAQIFETAGKLQKEQDLTI